MERAASARADLGELRAKLRQSPGRVAVVVPGGGDPEAVERELTARGIPVVRYQEEHRLDSPIRLDMARRLAFVDGARVDLPPKEFEILAELVARAGRPVPASELAKRVWPSQDHATSDDVHRVIYRLKRALGARGEEIISNRRGFGYVLNA